MAEDQAAAVHRALQPLTRAPRLSDRVADRMLVLHQGRVAGILAGDDLTRHNVLRLAVSPPAANPGGDRSCSRGIGG